MQLQKIMYDKLMVFIFQWNLLIFKSHIMIILCKRNQVWKLLVWKNKEINRIIFKSNDLSTSLTIK